MPSKQQAGERGERLRCPNTRERIGEDPARWLDQELISDDAAREMVLTLIDGIDSLERIAAWRAVERKLANDDYAEECRNPLADKRSKIIQRLDQREEWLAVHGERPDRLPLGPRRPCDCCDGDSAVSAAALRERDERDAGRLVEGYSPDGVDTSETSAQTEDATLGAFATDGGVDE